MAEAAEQVEQFPLEVFGIYQAGPQVVAVPEMPSDELVRRRAEKFIDNIGSVALEHEVELSEEPQIYSLMDAIHLAAEGDERAKKILRANASTDAVERVIKVKHVISVELEVDENNDIHQHGQPMEKVQENSWLFAAQRWQIKERVRAENNNAFRIKEHYRVGDLKDGSFVVISRAADNMDNDAMQKEGFFTDTMSCAIQVTTIKDGVLTTQSAFVAGVKEFGEERYDEQTVIKMGEALGVDFTDKTAADIIDTPLLIPNSLLPNGAIDLVRLWDICSGDTFFGQANHGAAKTQADYLEVVAESRRRELTFGDKVEAIVAELIARAPEVKTPLDATKLLNKVSGKHMVRQAVEDPSIDPRAFGEPAAADIMRARHHLALGNHQLAHAATKRAIKFEASSSCAGSGTMTTETETDVYGNTIGELGSAESKEWHGGKIHKNTKCRGCNKVKQEVGACHICKECVGKPAELKRSYQRQQTVQSREAKPKSGVVINFGEKLAAKQNREKKLGQGIVRIAA